MGAQKGHYKICKNLVEKGAKVNIKDNEEYTALHMGSQKG